MYKLTEIASVDSSKYEPVDRPAIEKAMAVYDAQVERLLNAKQIQTPNGFGQYSLSQSEPIVFTTSAQFIEKTPLAHVPSPYAEIQEQKLAENTAKDTREYLLRQYPELKALPFMNTQA